MKKTRAKSPNGVSTVPTQRYAVNLADIDGCFADSRQLPISMAAVLLGDFCNDKSPMIQIDKKTFDSTAIILDGPAAQDVKRVTGLIELLQTVIGPRKIHRRVRCYVEGPKGGWSEIRPDESQKDDDDGQE